MATAILVFVAMAAIIVVAGTWLSHFADQLAESTGLGRLLVGSVLLAGATSLPELTVDISAVRSGMVDLAAGDLLGSSLFNLLILAILDLSHYSRGHLLSNRAARHALSGNVSAALIAIMGMVLMARPVLANGEFLGITHGLFLVIAGYVLGIRLIYYDQRASRAETAQPEVSQELPKSWIPSAVGFVLAALVIVITGPFLAHSAGQIADASGLGRTFVGTTLVAFSTSLPELVASLTALRMKAYDLAIGNIFGSNTFNMLLFVPLDLVHAGPLVASISPAHAITCLASILATLVIVLGHLYHVERRRTLVEPDAWLVILIVGGALWLISQMGH